MREKDGDEEKYLNSNLISRIKINNDGEMNNFFLFCFNVWTPENE